MCENSKLGEPQPARSASRPIRPKPLIPMRAVVIAAQQPFDRRCSMERRRGYRLVDVDSIDSFRSMSVDLQLAPMELAPKVKRAAGEPCCAPVVYPDVDREHALRLATVAKALRSE